MRATTPIRSDSIPIGGRRSSRRRCRGSRTFPFGGGPRQCIGESFAWMESMLIVATIAQRWDLRLVPGHPVVLQPLITLRAKHGMRMTVEPVDSQ